MAMGVSAPSLLNTDSLHMYVHMRPRMGAFTLHTIHRADQWPFLRFEHLVYG